MLVKRSIRSRCCSVRSESTFLAFEWQASKWFAVLVTADNGMRERTWTGIWPPVVSQSSVHAICSSQFEVFVPVPRVSRILDFWSGFVVIGMRGWEINMELSMQYNLRCNWMNSSRAPFSWQSLQAKLPSPEHFWQVTRPRPVQVGQSICLRPLQEEQVAIPNPVQPEQSLFPEPKQAGQV